MGEGGKIWEKNGAGERGKKGGKRLGNGVIGGIKW